ncbi:MULTISPECIES: universal stress protein [Micromonospora]|uniref:universal stress protein n=1 Tax=Micromonospora TaxID=1873 RepID=UPI0007DB5425|nr:MULTISPECIES: universal stress protein [unclassified Micromonospora]MBP1782663.1 nucleotide-binding universal stress UspA family protein [Micromonospora sp. HB375]MBQ1068783.1 universal stress protein [Micromonospora sp. D75]MDH6468526.1 nucleotide-binding universal stress UspA family protein [Micromonospora sp. H404/HB375]RBQ08005.1 universal stress protein [Micromonospora sp. LHW51205]
MNRPVVVGVDGSPSSLAAADLAAATAVARSRPLVLVHGYLHPLGYGVPLNPYDLGVPAPTAEAEKMLESVAADLTERHPGLRVQVRQVAGGPGATMVEESRRAELVVVGSRGVGGFAGLLLGSVSGQLAQHGHCPVLIVRPEEQPIPVDGPVLVGVDGSDSAAYAIELAADEAERRDAELVLMHVRSPERGAVAPEVAAEASTAERAEAAGLLAEAADRVRSAHPGLRVTERSVTSPSPETALVEASGEAALVVVGSRGRGGFVGLLLGSVSQAMVQHSHCPVLVAHRPEPADD